MTADEALESETIVFADSVLKVNRRGVAQPRGVVVSTLALYNLKPRVLNRWQRRIGLQELEEVVLGPGTDGKWLMLLHMWALSDEYDCLLQFGSRADRDAVAEAVFSAFQALAGRPVTKLELSNDEILKRRVLKTHARARAKTADADAHRVKVSRDSTVRTNVAARKSMAVMSTSRPLGGKAGANGTAAASDAGLGSLASGSSLPSASAAAGPEASDDTVAASSRGTSSLSAIAEGSALVAARVRDTHCGPVDRMAWNRATHALCAAASQALSTIESRANSGDSTALGALSEARTRHAASESELGLSRAVADAVLHPQSSSTLHWWLNNMQPQAVTLFEVAAALSSRPFRPAPVDASEAATTGEDAEESKTGDADEEEEEEEEEEEDEEVAAVRARTGLSPPLRFLAQSHEEAGEARGWWLRVLWDMHTRAWEGPGGAGGSQKAKAAKRARVDTRAIAEGLGRFYEAVPALLASPFPSSAAFVTAVRGELARRHPAGASAGAHGSASGAAASAGGSGSGAAGSKDASPAAVAGGGFSSRSPGAAPWSAASAQLLEQAASSEWVREAVGADEGGDALVRAWTDRVLSAPGTRTGHAFVPLEEDVYFALLEIMMGQVHRPHDGERGAETFGQLVRQAPMAALIMRLAPAAPTWEAKLRIVKDMNVLLVRKDDNFARIMASGDWQAWLVPLLAVVPKAEEQRDVRVKEYAKYVMNFFSMVLYHVLAKQGDEIEASLGRLFAQMAKQAGGWTADVVSVARSVLSGLLVKVGSSSKRWRKDLGAPEWAGMFALAKAVEDFCFYRPEQVEQSGDMLRIAAVSAELGKISDRRRTREAPPPEAKLDQDSLTAAAEGGTDGAAAGPPLEWRAHGICAVSREGRVVPGLLPLLPEFASPAAVVPLASAADGRVDRGSPGVHLGESDAKPLDAKLAKRALTLLTKLGLKGGKPGPKATAAEKQVLRHGASLVDAFAAVCGFFDAVGKQGTAALSQLPDLLAKRQREQRTGFLSRAPASKKQLAAQLDASLMRQQAQREVRKQLKAQIDKIGDAIEIQDEPDIDEAALARARKRRHRRRTRASRVAATTDPVAAAAASAASGGAEERKEDEGGAREVDLRAKALSAALDNGIQGDDDDDADDQAGGSDAAASGSAAGREAGEDGDEEEEEEEEELGAEDCRVCGEGLEGRDTLHVPGFGTCHHDCVACSGCARHLSVEGDPSADDTALRTGGSAMCYEDKLFCRPHFLDQFGDAICAGCIVPFRKGERVVEAVGRRWHPEHLVCEACSEPFLDGRCFGVDGLPYCTRCHTDLFLRCNGCGETVEESDDGLSALGKTWHRRCFVCADCSCTFADGKFYSRDGRPYCEEHYFENFAPKCAKCARPVVSDGLRACGAVWHQECFTCLTCGEGFADGKFMERDGQPYCEEHFLELFGQRCGGCGLVIRDKYLQAMDQSWHPECFVCGECGCGFDDGAYFTHEGRPYCREHFGSLFCERCPGCGEPIVDGTTIKIGDDKWHAECLRCDQCSGVLDGKMMALGDPVRRYHHHCFTCDTCSAPLVDPDTGIGKYSTHEEKKLCIDCYAQAAGPRCSGCGNVITAGQTAVTALGGKWHPACFTCLACELPVEGSMGAINGRPLCSNCLQQSKPACPTCGKAVEGTYKAVLDRAYHDECIVCAESGCSLEAGAVERAGWPVCKDHAAGGDAWTEEAQTRIDAWTAYAEKQAKVIEAVTTAKAAPKHEPPMAAPKPKADVNSQYTVFRDEEGDVYYVHKETGESRWDEPEGFDASRMVVEGEGSAAAAEDDTDPNHVWKAFADEEGDVYYVNQLTQESVWERPDGFTGEPE